MSSLLYYFPKAEPFYDPKQIPAACELDHLAGAKIKTSSKVYRDGPDGGMGAVIVVEPGGGKAAKCGIYPDKQTWHPVRNGDQVTHYLGWESENPPGPSDLERPKQVEGHPVELGDGNKWVIPCVHVPSPANTMPMAYTIGDDGAFSLSLLPGYEKLMEMSVVWHDRANSSESFRFSHLEFAEYAVALLAVNYHVGWHEVLRLALIHTSAAMFNEIVLASLGGPDLVAYAKAQKKSGTPTSGSEVSVGDVG
ncbi:hypothetical protein Pan216_20880 [Planctomycetes bacterium Pan216]|uniref:Uncharacterized protein n=1 Tax=Kolteria novifilia TaxID=2527975 RepID=A0A518B2S0_9BACT|nr:hypothetical protein Pan216_20880 [Planctomycetes bacterium Pan216]